MRTPSTTRKCGASFYILRYAWDMPPACPVRHDDSCFLAVKIGNANTEPRPKGRGFFMPASVHFLTLKISIVNTKLHTLVWSYILIYGLMSLRISSIDTVGRELAPAAILSDERCSPLLIVNKIYFLFTHCLWKRLTIRKKEDALC